MKGECYFDSNEFIDNVLDHFEPLSVDNQKLLLFGIAKMFVEMDEKLAKKDYSNRDIVMTEIRNYDIMITFFTKAPDELKKIGCDTKSFLIRQFQKGYADFMDKNKENA